MEQLSQFTLENSGHAVRSLNYFLNNISFLAVILHGSQKLEGIIEKGQRSRPGWYEPGKYSGIWPGIFSHKQVVRRNLMDTGLSLSCAWDSFDAFAKYSSDSGSVGTGMAAGGIEAVNQFGFNFFYAEPIIFGAMDATMKLLAKLSPGSKLGQINRELAGQAPKDLVKDGIPISYRLTRSLVGGSVGLLVINAIIAGFSKWITPRFAHAVGPMIDEFYHGTPPENITGKSAQRKT